MDINIRWQGMTVAAEKGRTLGEALRRSGHGTDMPCGGTGKCGKCRVRLLGEAAPPTKEELALLSPREIADGIRLACRAVLLGDVEARPVSRQEAVILTQGQEASLPAAAGEGFGAAVDIGTTTLAAALYDLSDGRRVDSRAMRNPQFSWGADVISRLEAAQNDLDLLADSVQAAVSHLLTQLRPEGDLRRTVIVGNTAMLYLFTRRDPSCLTAAPFEADCLFGTGCSLPLPEGPINAYLMSCCSAFIGADTTAALLAAQLEDGEALMDIGTNGEMALKIGGRLYACSTAAGPVFEGVSISCGMQAAPGAICSVRFENGRPAVTTVDDAAPLGLCGSGLVSAAAAMVEEGIIDTYGGLDESHPLVENGRFTLSEGVYISREDIRALQLAKAAIRAGLETLLEEGGLAPEELRGIALAGGFGTALDPSAAETIGLIPPGTAAKLRFIGNAALSGAAAVVRNPALEAESLALAKGVTVVPLASDPRFADHFIEYMLFGSEE